MPLLRDQNLQQLIDSYNEEIMRYSQLARPMTGADHAAAQGEAARYAGVNQRTAGEQARESGEEEIERAKTERDYWQARGKQGLQSGGAMQRRPGQYSMPHPRPEPHEPLYRPGSNMPRPEPHEPLERPHSAENKKWKADAVSASGSAIELNAAEMARWMGELEQGLRELQRGLEELEQGQRELRAGQQAYRQGNAEGMRWDQLAARQTENTNAAMQNSGSQAGMNPTGNFAPRPNQGRQPVIDSPAAPDQQRDYVPEQRIGQTTMPMTAQQSGVFDPAVSNQNAPIAPISAGRDPLESAVPDGMGTGYLRVGVYTARQSNPIPNARVTVFSEAPGGQPYASATTDDDGKIPIITIPVGTSSTSDVKAPFVVYNVSVEADGYYPRNGLQAQIFDGITALLWVELTPLPDTAWPPVNAGSMAR